MIKKILWTLIKHSVFKYNIDTLHKRGTTRFKSVSNETLGVLSSSTIKIIAVHPRPLPFSGSIIKTSTEKETLNQDFYI